MAEQLFAPPVVAWSPSWACISSEANLSSRREASLADGSPPRGLDNMLHWITYFGPERVAGLDLDSAGALDFVHVRDLHEGVEVVIGDQWPGEKDLLRLQHETEPLLLRPPGRLARGRRRLGL